MLLLLTVTLFSVRKWPVVVCNNLQLHQMSACVAKQYLNVINCGRWAERARQGERDRQTDTRGELVLNKGTRKE